MKINKVLLNQNLQSKVEVFSFVADELYAEGLIDDKLAYIASLEEREVQGTTGLIDGFAIPHGKCDAVKESAVVYIRNTSGIEWESLDGSLITDIFALAIPNTGEAHLDSLIAISSNLMEPEQCAKLRSLQNEEDIKNIFA